MPEIGVAHDTTDIEVADASRSVSARRDEGRREDGENGGSGGGLGDSGCPAAPTRIVDATAMLQQQRPRPGAPPYEPMLDLFTEKHVLRGVVPTDLATDGIDRLKAAVWFYTARNLVCVSMSAVADSSLEVILDTVDMLDPASSDNSGASSSGRRPSAVAGMRKPGQQDGSSGSSSTANDRMRECLFSDKVPAPKMKLGASRLETALLWWPWPLRHAWFRVIRKATTGALADLRVRRWATGPASNSSARKQGLGSRTASLVSELASAVAGLEHEQESSTLPSSPSADAAVIAGRITSVAPRAVLASAAATSAAIQKPPADTGVIAACLQVSAGVCCGGPSAAGDQIKACSSRMLVSSIAVGANAPGSCVSGPVMEILLRHSHTYSSVCTLSGNAPEAGAAPGPSARKACRRALCRQHFSLRQDICLAERPGGEATATTAAVARIRRLVPLEGGISDGLGPGLLLLDFGMYRSQGASAQQRPVPVVVLDDPWVTEELQAALADRQATACSAVNCDDLLVDLGVFLQHAAELRRTAAPALRLADAGLLRPGRLPPCCCSIGGNSGIRALSRFHRNMTRGRDAVGTEGATVSQGCACCSSFDRGGDPVAASAAVTGPVRAASKQNRAAPSRRPRCAACALRRLHEVLDHGPSLSMNLALHLGEGLLRHATTSGLTRTASHISTCLVDLRRINVLVAVMFAGSLRLPQPSAAGGLGGCVASTSGRLRTAAGAWTVSKWLSGTCFSCVPRPEAASSASLGGQCNLGFWGRVAGVLDLDVSAAATWSMVTIGFEVLFRAAISLLLRLAVQLRVALPVWLGGRLPVMVLSVFLACESADVILPWFGARVRTAAEGCRRSPPSVEAATSGTRR